MQGNNEVRNDRREFGHSCVSHRVWCVAPALSFLGEIGAGLGVCHFYAYHAGKKENLGSVNPGEVLIGNSYFETFSSLMYFSLGTYYCGKILSRLCKVFCQSLLGYFNFSFTMRYSGIL